MSDKLSEFEQQLARLKPTSSIDVPQVMFASGEAAALVRQASTARAWQCVAFATTCASVMLTCLMISSSSSLRDARRREIALQNELRDAEAMDTSHLDNRIAASNRNEGDGILGAQRRFTRKLQKPRLSSLAADSPYRLRRALQLDQPRTEVRAAGDEAVPRKQHTFSRPVTIGDFRRVLAMAGEAQTGVRRLQTLRP